MTARLDHPIHLVLIDSARPRRGSVLVDLGCGDGKTLAAGLHRDPGMVVVGLDSNQQQLAGTARRLTAAASGVRLVRTDLDQPLPLREGSIDAMVCHNVLEYLGHPSDLLSEAARVLRPGGRAVWSHVEWASVVLNASDADLNRRVIDTHTTYTPRWMRHADGYIGRKLPGLARGSLLEMVDIDVVVVNETQFVGHARWRVDQILHTLLPPARRQDIELTPADLDRWLADLDAADAADEFFFTEATVVVTTQRPAR